MDLKYEHQSTNMNTQFWGWVGGGVGYYNFPRSTNKIKSFDKILTSEKIIFFAFFCCGGGSNLILGTGMENQIFILRTPAAIKFFHQILKNCHFGVKINSSSKQMDLYDPYKSHHTISYGNFNFPRSTNKIPYFDEISTS